jgi:hypothetical protein
MIKYHNDIIQGSEEWLQIRCGLITASEMKLLLTPTLKVANNEKERQHIYELVAQRANDYVEPTYISDDMVNGGFNEIIARDLYSEHIAQVEEVGFVTNDKWGFTLGYSPDGLVGDDGLIEVKSRRQKYQMQVILDRDIATEHLLQAQTGLLVSERKWLDYLSFCGGMPMIPF